MRLLPAAAIFLVALASLACGSVDNTTNYDPLELDEGQITVVDLVARDEARQRDIPVRVFLPAAAEPAPVVLYSHGLGGSRTTAGFLGEHWAGRGYVAVFMQHPGSDESVWMDGAPGDTIGALSGAATAANLLLRLQDVSAVIAQIEDWNGLARHPLNGRVDTSRVGMSGHSFGAMTTQGVSGQRYPAAPNLTPHPQIKAAIAFSPSAPAQGSADVAFGSVGIPWLLMTGTNDVAALGASLEERLRVYPALPDTIDKYELILDEAQHYVFTDRNLLPTEPARNPNHHRVILALSTAFWDAYLRQDRAAIDWLQGDGARSLLEAQDSWRLVAGGRR